MQVCDSLRRMGYDGHLLLLGEESDLPYQRPPLSKKFLAGGIDAERLLFRPANYFEKQKIEVRCGVSVTAVDPVARTLTIDGSEALAYERLALTTGTRIRELNCPGAADADIYYVRTLEDSRRLKSRLEHSRRLAVIGGGFIGLEVAATAREAGNEVFVVEALDRLMARAVSPQISDFYRELHQSRGIDVRLSTGVEAIESADATYTVKLSGGENIVVDTIVAGIGVIPNSELAQTAGLDCDNGIVVDVHARTSEPTIVAAGDCTMHDNGFLGRRIRLESVQNAVDQAKTAAASMLGIEQEYNRVPWFWSDQFDVKLQMAGIGQPCEATALRGDIESGQFSLFYFREGKLAGADSINSPADHMACRKLLERGLELSPEQASDQAYDLMQLAKS